MDPDANLKEQISLSSEILNAISQGEIKESPIELSAERLSELVKALNEWLVNGGFLPTSWQHRNETITLLKREILKSHRAAYDNGGCGSSIEKLIEHWYAKGRYEALNEVLQRLS